MKIFLLFFLTFEQSFIIKVPDLIARPPVVESEIRQKYQLEHLHSLIPHYLPGAGGVDGMD